MIHHLLKFHTINALIGTLVAPQQPLVQEVQLLPLGLLLLVQLVQTIHVQVALHVLLFLETAKQLMILSALHVVLDKHGGHAM